MDRFHLLSSREVIISWYQLVSLYFSRGTLPPKKGGLKGHPTGGA